MKRVLHWNPRVLECRFQILEGEMRRKADVTFQLSVVMLDGGEAAMGDVAQISLMLDISSERDALRTLPFTRHINARRVLSNVWVDPLSFAAQSTIRAGITAANFVKEVLLQEGRMEVRLLPEGAMEFTLLWERYRGTALLPAVFVPRYFDCLH